MSSPKKLRPFFCRPGSKKRIAKFVLEYFPKDDSYTTYVEPFFGGGALFWEKEPSPIEVINDLDSDLIKHYKILQSIRTRDFPKGLNTIDKIQRFVDIKPTTNAESLTRKLLLMCNTFRALGTATKIYQSASPYKKLERIDEYQERMKDVKIYNKSYEKILKQYDSPKTFFYLDPPYEEKETTGKIYQHGGLSFDFEGLRKHLDNLKGKWLLSINDSPNIRRIFKGYYYKSFVLKGFGGIDEIGSKPRKELLISNFKN